MAGRSALRRCVLCSRAWALGVACCACVAPEFPADGAGRSIEQPRHLSDAQLLLDQTGQRHTLFRLKLLVMSRGALHLRTLQAGRCCTSLLNPPFCLACGDAQG